MKKSPSISLLVLLSIINAISGEYVTPTDGPFFYSEYYYEKGDAYIRVDIGSDKDPLNVRFNSEELSLAVFTRDCTQPTLGKACKVPQSYEYVDDDYNTRTTANMPNSNEIAYLYNDGAIQRFQFSGLEAETHLNFTVGSYYRQFDYPGYVFSIVQIVADNDFSSDTISGYVGIGPYTAIQYAQNQVIQPGENFLYQLRQENFIKYQVIAFYLDSENSANSYVKFGGYDSQAFEDPDNVILLEMQNDHDWIFRANKLQIQNGEVAPLTYNSQKVIIEPAYPYFHVPANILNDWKTRAQDQNIFKDVEFKSNGVMVFNKPCGDVPTAKSYFTMEFDEEIGKKQIRFDLSDMLVPSEWIDASEQGKCYLGVLPNTGAKDTDAFYLGQLYFKKYYTYFDVNGVQDEGQSFLRIGTGLRNKNINMLQIQYNENLEGHDHREQDLSQWTYEPNPMMSDYNNAVMRFIKKNMILFIVCCVILALLIITLFALCIYLRKKSNANRMNNVFKDKLTYYGKQNTNTKVQQMDLSMSLDNEENDNSTSQNNKELLMGNRGKNLVS